MKNLIPRINELARKEKTIGLDELEKQEQKELRTKYIESFRSSFKDTLMQVKIVDPMGNDVTPEKLIKEQNKKKN